MFLSIAASAAASAAESVAETIAETTAAQTASSMLPEDFVFDYASRVPVLSMIFMGISLIMMIVLPCFLLIRSKNRFRFDMMALFHGLLAYLLGLGVLPSVIEMLLGMIPQVRTLVTDSPAAGGTLHAILLALLSFAAIWLCLRFALKRSANVLGTSLYMGIAITIMPILTQGITYLMSYLSASMSINQGQLAGSVSAMLAEGTAAADIQQGLDSMTAFIETPSFEFLYVGIDLSFQLLYFLGLTILLCLYVSRRAPQSALYKALGLQAGFAVFYALRCCGLLENTYLCAVIYLLVAAASLFLAYQELRTCMPEELEKLLGKPDPSLSLKTRDKDEKPHKMPKIVMPKD